MEKAFLVDVASKIYVATDSSFVDMPIYELASDMIDVVIDISCIYGFVFHLFLLQSLFIYFFLIALKIMKIWLMILLLNLL